jgi:hypothetical protein
MRGKTPGHFPRQAHQAIRVTKHMATVWKAMYEEKEMLKSLSLLEQELVEV